MAVFVQPRSPAFLQLGHRHAETALDQRTEIRRPRLPHVFEHRRQLRATQRIGEEPIAHQGCRQVAIARRRRAAEELLEWRQLELAVRDLTAHLGSEVTPGDHARFVSYGDPLEEPARAAGEAEHLCGERMRRLVYA